MTTRTPACPASWPNNAPGFEIVPMPHMMGCRGAGHAGLKFTNLVLEPKYLLGKEGQGMEIAIHSLSVSRAHRHVQPWHGPAYARDLPQAR